MHLITVITLALLTACSACGSTPNYVTSQAPTLSDPAVAKLSVGGEGTCTIWKTTDGLAVTAGHCCEPDTMYSATGPHAVPGATFEVLFDDDTHDVCVLRGKMLGQPITLAAFDPQIGERIWTAGYPHGKYLISDGYWAGRDEENEGICSSVVGFGASGSPIMNSRNESVGVLIKKFRDMDNLTFVAPIEWVKRAVAVAKTKK
jgi:hypothetical protein